jgi:hypothetical protein
VTKREATQYHFLAGVEFDKLGFNPKITSGLPTSLGLCFPLPALIAAQLITAP